MLTVEYRIYLLAFVTSLEGQTTANLTVYATSAFKVHSLVATVLVVQGVVNGMFSLFQVQNRSAPRYIPIQYSPSWLHILRD